MTLASDVMKRVMEKFGGIIDLKERPEILDELVDEVVARVKAGENAQPPASPFGLSWMDSWVAHWVYAENLTKVRRQDRELATVLQSLVDLRFQARLDEIRRFIRDVGIHTEPPDAGPPEPGVPPGGPARFEPPDGGPPEPGVPPGGPARFEPPDGGPPEPGVPPGGPARFEPPDGGTPEPGVPPGPPTGPDIGAFGENPWILYWFLSIKTPMLLDVIDLHITRRLEALRRG
jgi:hypothetical protein